MTRPHLMMSFDFDLELIVAKTACMHAIVATYIPVPGI